MAQRVFPPCSQHGPLHHHEEVGDANDTVSLERTDDSTGAREDIASLDVVERATRRLQAPELGGEERGAAPAAAEVTLDGGVAVAAAPERDEMLTAMTPDRNPLLAESLSERSMAAATSVVNSRRPSR